MNVSAEPTGTGSFNGGLDRLAELRARLMRMEEELGLSALSRTERDLLYSAREVADDKGRLTSADLRDHRLVASLPPASFHRALRALLEHGHLRLAEESRARHYVLVSRATADG
ncbi:MAG: MarR family transcriptional regulator [Rhodobacteraceae bacterium]|nr:MarR family transcriptional regulator [Paracoccaceae bacterium]